MNDLLNTKLQGRFFEFLTLFKIPLLLVWLWHSLLASPLFRYQSFRMKAIYKSSIFLILIVFTQTLSSRCGLNLVAFISQTSIKTGTKKLQISSVEKLLYETPCACKGLGLSAKSRSLNRTFSGRPIFTLLNLTN